MPRIYYNRADYERNRTLLAITALIAVVLSTLAWIYQPALAPIVTFIAAGFVASHAWWRAAMNDWVGTGLVPLVDIQRATYERLQRKHGEDWDLNVSVEEFDLERRKAELRAKLDHVPMYTLSTGIVAVVIWSALLFFSGDALPLPMLISYGSGVLAVNLLLQMILRHQLRENQRKLQAKRAQKSAKKKVAMPQMTPAGLSPHPSMRYTVGDDGERVPVKNNGRTVDTHARQGTGPAGKAF